MDNNMGKYIEKLRKEKGLTQKELAKQLGLSNTAISKWECGYNLPDISMLGPLSKILDADILDLLGYLNREEAKQPTEEEIKLEKDRKFKFYIIVTIISLLLINFIIISASIIIKNNSIKSEEEKVQVYELTSKDSRVNINGYIIFNNENKLMIIRKLNYQENLRGTKEEILTNNIRVYIKVDEKIIYKYETNYTDNQKYRLSDIFEKLDFEDNDYFNNDIDMKNIDLTDTKLVINFTDFNEKEHEIESEIALKELFT